MMKTVKNRRKRFFYGILVIVWMILVFSFSNQNGDKSQSTSDIITDKVVEIITKINSSVEYESTKACISFIIRKLAHFSIYFIGGILIFNFVNTFSIKLKYKILLSIIFGVLYAISDEIHQFFIAERSAQIKDVLIDSLGVIIAIFLRSKLEGEKWKN